MDRLRIGRYQVENDGSRLRVMAPPGICVRLGLREHAPVLEVLGPSEIHEVRVSRRRPRGSDLKRPWTARPWELRVSGRNDERLGGTLRFRSADEAQQLSVVLEKFRS